MYENNIFENYEYRPNLFADSSYSENALKVEKPWCNWKSHGPESDYSGTSAHMQVLIIYRWEHALSW